MIPQAVGMKEENFCILAGPLPSESIVSSYQEALDKTKKLGLPRKQPVAAVSDLWCGQPAGLMQKLTSAKLVVQEPHNVSGDVFEEAINTYRCEMCILSPFI